MTFEDLISERDFARERGVSLRTVQRERAMRVGPPFIRLNRRIFYRREAIAEWLLSLEQAQPRSPVRGAA
ncbi:MAG: DNA-binding protein [Roseicyclus sp.]